MNLNDYYFGSDDFEFPLGNIQIARQVARALMSLTMKVFVYEGWSKLADLKEYSKKIPGGVLLTLATGAGEFFG